MTTTHVIFLLCTIAVLGAQLRAESAPAAQKPRIVTAKELNEGTAVIIGDLGVPLITAVEIVATVEEELSPYLEKPDGRPIPTGTYVLKVEEINGKKLAEPQTLRFFLSHAMNVAVAPNEAELDELLKSLASLANDPGFQADLNSDGKRFFPNIRNVADAAAYRQSYVGSRHRLVVYEEARQDGEPAILPPDSWSWGVGVDHKRFETYLCVLRERKL